MLTNVAAVVIIKIVILNVELRFVFLRTEVRFDKPTMDFISSGQFYRSSNSRGSIK
jgi:hypothetical protein